LAAAQQLSQSELVILGQLTVKPNTSDLGVKTI
jgi:hypothetical protein